MQKLRSIHLYLGCIFAPLLLFFAISGIWQTIGLRTPLLEKLSSIHTEARWKNGNEWGSFPLRLFVLAMAIAFIITTVLGIVMAIRFGRSRKAAYLCLAIGTIVPVALVLMRVLR